MERRGWVVGRLPASGKSIFCPAVFQGSGFRLVVNGHVGVQEIERLIAKLELDKGARGGETGNG